MVRNMRKKSKFEKGFLAMLMAPEIVLITAMAVSGIIYLFIS